MNMNDVHGIIEQKKRIEDALSTTIKISHDQVMDIVVQELISKYKAAFNRDDNCWPAFRQVLRFYLTEDELTELLHPTNC